MFKNWYIKKQIGLLNECLNNLEINSINENTVIQPNLDQINKILDRIEYRSQTPFPEQQFQSFIHNQVQQAKSLIQSISGAIPKPRIKQEALVYDIGKIMSNGIMEPETIYQNLLKQYPSLSLQSFKRVYPQAKDRFQAMKQYT